MEAESASGGASASGPATGPASERPGTMAIALDGGHWMLLRFRAAQAGTGSFSQRMAHYQCELALEADAKGDGATATALLDKAQALAPQAARPR